MNNDFDEIKRLLMSISDDIYAWDWDADEEGPALEPAYAERIERLGRTRVLRHIFLVYTVSMGTTLILHLSFVWKDLHYREWLRVLAEAPDIQEVEAEYFHTFFAGYLAIDFWQAVKEADIPKYLKERLAPQGGRRLEEPRWGHVDDVFADMGLDPFAIWRRLASEGAPMLVSPERLASGISARE